jgi:hypothetical protein
LSLHADRLSSSPDPDRHTMMRYAIFFCGLLLAWRGLAGEPEPQSEEWRIFAECRSVVLPQKLALRLIPDLEEQTKLEAAWVRLDEMIESGEAQLAADLVIQGRAGHSLVASSHEERRYSDGEMPVDIPDRLPPKTAPNALPAWPLIGTSPTAFATQDVGELLEIKTIVSPDGKWLAISVNANQTRFEGWRKIPFADLPWGERLAVERPLFDQLSNKSDLRLSLLFPQEEGFGETWFPILLTRKAPLFIIRASQIGFFQPLPAAERRK